MKILLVVPEYPPYNTGGGGVVYENLAKGLSSLKNDVIVVWGFHATNSVFTKTDRYEKGNIRFYMVPEIPHPKTKPYLKTAMPPNLFGFMELFEIIKREKPQVANLHGYGHLLINIASFYCKLHKIPYVLTIHGYPRTPEKNILFKILWKFYEMTLMKLTLRNSKKIIFVSRWLMENKSVKNYIKKSKVIYNGIDTDVHQASNQNKLFDIRDKHRLPADSIILFSVGRISKMKGYNLVINALPELITRFPSIFYLIAGADYSFKASLVKLSRDMKVEDRIVFVGYLTAKEKREYMQQCNVFLVPSLWEPFGLVALEGLKMRKVLVTSGEGGLKEFLNASKNVIFFNKDDPGSLIDPIEKIASEEVRYVDENFLEKFCWEKVSRNYYDVYRNIQKMRVKN